MKTLQISYLSILASVLFLLVINLHETASLFCYRCLSWECSGPPTTCEEAREFLVSTLGEFYFLESELSPCPKIDETLDWTTAQLKVGPCCDKTLPKCQREATCTLGRLQVISEVEAGQTFSKITSYGTVLGCANTNLLGRMKEATLLNKCSVQYLNGSIKSGSRHFVALEHCNQVTDSCTETDFCINYKESIVKPFNQQASNRRFEFGLFAGIIATVVLIILAIMGASLCWGPLNSARNFSPKTPVAATSFSPIENENYQNLNSDTEDNINSISAVHNGDGSSTRSDRKSSYI